MRAMLRAWAHALVGAKRLGWIDYYRFPARRSSWGGPLNGQPRRQELFRELLAEFAPDYVVETGTFRGTTTAWFARQLPNRPIHSVEADPRNFGFASRALKDFANVHVVLGDSRAFLRDLLAQPPIRGGVGFFYLDAHWSEDLPLGEEVDAVFSAVPRAVVAIDDFCVPGEPDYGFDDYGSGRRLQAELLQEVVAKHTLALFYPAAPAATEGGARRGLGLLAGARDIVARLASLESVRQ